MAYKVLDIFKDLPKTNCGDCGKASCFVMASAVYLEAYPLSSCPHLAPEALSVMGAKLEGGRAQGEGRRPESSEQALRALLGKIAGADFRELARNCGAAYVSASPETLELKFLGVGHRITRQGVTTSGPEPPSVWVKIFLLIYVTRANGAPLKDQWASYRELPNTTSKSKSFDENTEQLARHFEGRSGALDAAAVSAGGERTSFGSAERAYLFRALPRVPLLLLFWEPQEDFPARASLLMDKGVLEYLDQEAIVFLAEAFTQRLLGKRPAGVVPRP